MGLTPGQRACIETLDAPLAVSAGAGSGKTYTLTRRIVGALASGYLDDIGQVLAITFTSKAAGEIKSRVKGALRAQGMADQALKVDEAWISTIHGMCARILRAHALALGVDPAFEVADEAHVRTLLDEAIEEVLGTDDDLVSVAGGAEAAGGAGPSAGVPSPAALDALFAEYRVRSAGGVGGSSVEDMVRTLVVQASAHPDGMASLALPPAPESPYRLLADLVDAAETAAALADAVKPGARRDAFLQATHEALEAAQQALAGDGLAYGDVLALACAFPVPGLGFGKKDAYGEQAPELAQRYQAAAAQARAGVAAPHLDTLLRLAGLVAHSFSRRKRAAGLLDNNDLLAFAARAFRDVPDVAAAYRDRFRLVMVDEFQDTDQLQVDMIKRMAGEGFARMCTVGDAQQSIYRFRGADVSVYRRHVADVQRANPQGLIELPDNFRSHRDVLALCDRVFEQPQVFGREFMSLAPGRSEAQVKRPFLGDGPRVEVQLTTVPYRGVPAGDAVRAAARRIAESFAALRDAGHSPSDMVVLLGGMAQAGAYAAALREAGLACVVAGGSIFNRAPEVRLMVRLAQVIANPRWTAALFEVLSSEMFALSADDLLVLSTGRDEERGIPRRRSFDEGFRRVAAAVREGAEVSPALAAAAAVMRKMAAMAGRAPVARIMEAAVVDSGWLARMEAAGPEGLARAGNVYKAIRMAEDIERAGGIGPSGVARALALRVELAKEAPGALSAGGGDFVRIMTVHASKGLEFPIVAVAELRGDGVRVPALATCSVGGRTFVSLDAGASLSPFAEKQSSLVAKSAGYQPFSELDEDELAAAVASAADPASQRAAIRLHEARGEAAEARRLLYVALTRAKEALVVSMRGKRTKDDPTGLSKGAYGDVQSALAGVGGFFEPGVSMIGFGGERPARVERIDLMAADEASEGEGAGQAADGRFADSEAPGRIAIPVVPPYTEQPDAPYAPARAGVFSYSSISGEDPAGAGGGGLLGAGAAAAGVGAEASPSPEDEGDDAAWDAICASLAGADAATDLGTAFHRLAQYAVNAWEGPGVPLARPPAAREEALARGCGLSPAQRARLDAALERWFGSALAARVASCRQVRAEVPFFVPVEGEAAASGSSAAGAAPAGEAALPPRRFMEGEIDLLATDGPDGAALIVDYKTGGAPYEEPERLHAKHLLQARCYAYAVLLQGYGSVEAVFVRVEQADAADSSQPQTVRYRFEADDLPNLRGLIADAARSAGVAPC